MDLTIYTDDKKPVELSDMIIIIIDKLQTDYIYPCLFINKLWNKCVHKKFYGIIPDLLVLRLRFNFIYCTVVEGDEKMAEFVKFVLG